MRLAVVAAAVMVCGCASKAAWVYKAGAKVVADGPTIPARVVVTPFKDSRSERNQNALWTAVIPLCPIGTARYERPDAATAFLAHQAYNARPAEDYAKAVVEEIKGNSLFTEVFFSNREQEPGVDLVLTGEIKKSTYEASMVTWGTALTWLFGAPVGFSKNTLVVSLELRRPDGSQVWTHAIHGRYSKTIGLAYNFASELEGYPLILRDGLQAGIKSLATHLREKGLGGPLLATTAGDEKTPIVPASPSPQTVAREKSKKDRLSSSDWPTARNAPAASSRHSESSPP